MEAIINKINREILKKELGAGRFVRKTNNGNNEIYIMQPDGTKQMRLTNNLISDWQPRWGK